MEEISLIEVNDKQSIALVEALAGEIWHEHYAHILDKSQIKYMTEKFQSKEAIFEQIKEGYKYYLITCGENYSGYLSIIFKVDYLFLSKIYLKSNSRGKGIGRQVLEFVEKIAKEQELARIKLTVNKNNINTIKAYKKWGFEITDSVVSDIGNGFVMDDYVMEKIIS